MAPDEKGRDVPVAKRVVPSELWRVLPANAARPVGGEHRLVVKAPPNAWMAGRVVVCETLQPTGANAASFGTAVVQMCQPEELHFH
jgi:hypothetical protein